MAGLRLRVASFNIRNSHALDGRHSWALRRRATATALADLEADVVGLQEACGSQLRWLLRQLPRYAAVGAGRNRSGGGERCAVLVRPERFTIVEARTRWFGDSPDTPGSRVPGARFPRIAAIVTGEVGGAGLIQLANTHLDERSPARRERSVTQLLGWLDPALPQIVVGDLNATPGSRVLELLRSAGLRPALADDARGTAHRFSGRPDGARLDHILVSHHWDVRAARVAATPGRRPLPSDHWPVLADLAVEPRISG